MRRVADPVPLGTMISLRARGGASGRRIFMIAGRRGRLLALLCRSQPSTSRQLLGVERTYWKHRRTVEFDPQQTLRGQGKMSTANHDFEQWGRSVLLQHLFID